MGKGKGKGHGRQEAQHMENTALQAITPQETAAREISTGLFYEFTEWIDRNEKTTRTYLTNLRQFLAWLRYTATTRPTRKDVISYRDYLTAEHPGIKYAPESPDGWEYRTDRTGQPIRINCKPNTIAQYLRSVCQFFRWTAANNLYPDVAANIHAPKIDHSTHRKEALTAAEVLKIEKSIETRSQERRQEAAQSVKDTAGHIQRTDEQGKRLFAMYLLTVNAGLRTIEISRANVKDLETKGGQSWLYIWGKGHTEPDQKKPIAPEIAAALKEYIQSRADHPIGSSPLFVATGNRSGGKRLAPTTISTMLKRALQGAGFDSERLTAHSLRHTAGTAIQEITGNLYITQKYMRHANPATTEIYLHNDTAKQETGIAQQLYNLYHGKETTGQREKLENIINRLTPLQLDQLTGIAAAMA